MTCRLNVRSLAIATLCYLPMGITLLDAGTAYAQVDPTRPQPVRLKLSAVFPTDGDTKDILGSTLLGGGFGYDFANRANANYQAAPVVGFGYIEYTGATRTENNVRLEARYTALGAGARFYPAVKKALAAGKPATESGLYLGLGFGFYYQTYYQTNQVSNIVTESVRNEVRFGGKLFLGMDIGQRLFVEGDWTWPGESKLNTLNASVGIRL